MFVEDILSIYTGPPAVLGLEEKRSSTWEGGKN
jgi:hypothetical protein